MLKRGLIGLFLPLALSAVAAADNVISEWGGAAGGYVIEQNDKRVTLFAPGTYKFQALDPNGPEGLGIINHITVDPNCPAGTVSVSVLASDNTNRGALHLREINLTHATDGRIARVFIRGDCAEYGQVRANRIGDIGVDGSVLNDVVVDWLDGGIGCHGAANITVSSGTTPAAKIYVWTDYSGTMTVTGTPWIVVNGAMSGTIDVTGDLYSLTLLDFPQPGVVTVHGSVGPALFAAGNLAGTFHVTGDLLGLVELGEHSLTGSLIVDGNVATNGAIWIRYANADIAGLV